MNKKYFFVSMMCSLLIIALIMGLSIVEKNTQTIISGETSSFVSYSSVNDEIKYFRFRFMGQEIIFNF